MVKKYTGKEIEKLSDILKNDGIIAVPTDTVYGICGVITSKKAKDKLVNIKKRPENKSFPIMCANEEQIKSVAIVTERVEKIIKAFMPGPITIILKKKDDVPEYITNGKDTIAVRMATSKVLENLIKRIGSPVFMTSANKSGEAECINVEDIEKACPNLDGILDGNIIFKKASTIVDCSSDEIKLSRKGLISLEEITRVIENEGKSSFSYNTRK